MLQKSARPGYKRVIKKTALVLLAAEAIAFGVSYAGWYRLNTDRGEMIVFYLWILALENSVVRTLFLVS